MFKYGAYAHVECEDGDNLDVVGCGELNVEKYLLEPKREQGQQNRGDDEHILVQAGEEPKGNIGEESGGEEPENNDGESAGLTVDEFQFLACHEIRPEPIDVEPYEALILQQAEDFGYGDEDEEKHGVWDEEGPGLLEKVFAEGQIRPPEGEKTGGERKRGIWKDLMYCIPKGSSPMPA